MAISAWVHVGLFATLALMVFPEAGAFEIANLYLAVVTLGLIALVMLLLRELQGLRFRDIVASISRPLIAVSVMALCVIFVARVAGLEGWYLFDYQDTCWCGGLLSEHPCTVVNFRTTCRCRVVSIGQGKAVAKALMSYGPGGPAERNVKYVKRKRCRNASAS